MLDQLQFHKHVEKRQMITFDPTFNAKGYLTRGEGIVKGTGHTNFSTLPGDTGFRNLNPNCRTIPFSNAALKPTPIKHNSPYNIGLPSSGNNILQGQGGMTLPVSQSRAFRTQQVGQPIKPKVSQV